ncbi:hypothetical protein AB0939_08715 [Streptomyces sp. NPDC006990]|uniref:hypothetical protein n=1 Tax=unclassified Streptomyces TaxID=2593676 RepID=UPI0034556DF6
MGERKLARGTKWALRTLIVLVGAFAMGGGALASLDAWEEARIGLGFDGGPGRFVATACETQSSGRGGPTTVCTGTFTSDDGRTVEESRLKEGGEGMSVGDSHRVRCDDGTCVFAGQTAIGGVLVYPVLTVLAPVAAFSLAREVGSRRKRARYAERRLDETG